MMRWLARVDAKITAWFEGPQGEARCPWTTAAFREPGERCIKKAGHRGACQTGKEFPNGHQEFRSWYGINYPDRDKGVPL